MKRDERGGAYMPVSCGYYVPSLGSVSSLFLTFTIILKKIVMPQWLQKTNKRIFWLLESKIGECLDASIFFIIGSSNLNSNRICHLSLNCRQCGINPFEQPFGIICRIFICH